MRRPLRAVALATAALASAGSMAYGYWSSPSAPGGSGQVVAATLPRANTPSASVVGPRVSVRWSPSSFSGASPGYELLRYASSGGAPAGPPVVVPCTPAPVAAGDLACTEDPAPTGTYHYAVRTTLNAWRGQPSPPSTAVAVYNDTTAPTTSATTTPAVPLSGWLATSPVQLNLSAIDDVGGSGVAEVRYTLDSSDPAGSPTAVVYTGPVTLAATTTVRFAARDAANNWEAPQAYTVQIDTQPPSSALALTAASGAWLSGSTVFYRGAAAGSFALVNAVSDGDSGAASSTTSALSGAATGWSHTPGTVATPAGGPFVSAAFSWVAGTRSSPSETVTASDRAGNSASETLTFVDDSSAPTVSASASPEPGTGGWNNSAVDITLTAADDAAGSGLDRVRYTTDGSSPLNSPSAQTYNEPITLTSSATVRFAAFDHVGNASGIGNHSVEVDTTAPTNALSLTGVTGGAFLAGSTLYYRGAAPGSFALENTVSDADSGAASSASALGGTTAGWSHTASTVTRRTGGSFVSNPFSWTAGTTSSPIATLTGTDVAGNSAQIAVTFVDDSAAPSAGVDFPGAVSYTSGSGWNGGCATPAGDVCGGVADGGAGVASVKLVLARSSDGRCWNPASNRFQPAACGGVVPSSLDTSAGTWSVSFPCAADSYTLDVTVADIVGNAVTLPRRSWQITGCAG